MPQNTLDLQRTNKIPTQKIASTIYPLILHLINLRSSPYQKLTSQLFVVINLGFLKVVSYITNMFLLLTKYICRIVVPFILRHKIFNLIHHTPVARYMGEYKTLYRIRLRFSWPRMCTDITKNVLIVHSHTTGDVVVKN